MTSDRLLMVYSVKKTIVKGAVRDNLQAQIDLAQHIESIANSTNGHTDVHMKNIRNTRKREQNKHHRDYMKRCCTANFVPFFCSERSKDRYNLL